MEDAPETVERRGASLAGDGSIGDWGGLGSDLEDFRNIPLAQPIEPNQDFDGYKMVLLSNAHEEADPTEEAGSEKGDSETLGDDGRSSKSKAAFLGKGGDFHHNFWEIVNDYHGYRSELTRTQGDSAGGTATQAAGDGSGQRTRQTAKRKPGLYFWAVERGDCGQRPRLQRPATEKRRLPRKNAPKNAGSGALEGFVWTVGGRRVGLADW